MATIVGTPEDDSLPGTERADDMAGLDGGDTLRGALGDDQIDGGSGDDLLDGGPDNDTIFGGPGDDDIFDGSHDDSLFGGIGDDTLRASQGFDNLDGGAGDDVLIGGFGYVTMVGGGGNDTLTAGPNGSNLNGGDGDDSMRGGIGSDFFTSGEDDADTFTVVRFEGDFGFDRIDGFNIMGDVLRLEGFEPGFFKVTERVQFSGPIYVEAADGAVSTNAAGVELPADTTTEEAVSELSGRYGPPTDAVTTFTSDQGTITVDAVGLVEGRDYVFVPDILIA